MQDKRSTSAKSPVITKRHTGLFLLLLSFWFILCGRIDIRQVITGTFTCLCTILLYEWILKHAGIKDFPPFPKVKWVRFFFRMILFIGESAWHHFSRIISGNEDITFIHVTLDVSHPISRILIANAITLAPGTVSVDMDKDILKVLCFQPKSEKEHEALYHMIDTLQSYFKEDAAC